MARRNTKQRDNDNRTGKREREARIERMTWFLLVLIFAILYFVPDNTLPNWLVPAAGALILLGSGVVQYARRMAVSPITWIAGSLMLMMSLYSVYINPNTDLLGFSLVVFAVVIGFGVITGET
jgi:hypothetical protein